MMAGRLTRFLNLERPRTAASEAPPHEVATKARFEGNGEIGLAFDFGEQPFLRCPSCEADNNKQAEKCFNCQRSLLGEEVKAWNAAFWERRKQEQPPPAPPQTPALVDEQNRKVAELMALQVAEHEKSRLRWWNSDLHDSTPAGLQLLSRIANQNTRFMVAMGMVLTFLGAGFLALTAKHHPGLQVASAVVAMSLFLLFMPNTRRSRRWWDD